MLEYVEPDTAIRKNRHVLDSATRKFVIVVLNTMNHCYFFAFNHDTSGRVADKRMGAFIVVLFVYFEQ